MRAPDSHRLRPQVGIAARILRPRLQLIRVRELRHRNRILIGMSGPRAIHQAVGFVLLVFFENGQRARIQFRIFAAGIQRGHPANRQNAAVVADLRHQFPQVLKESNVVRNRVAVRQNPVWIVEIEMNQAGHVIPAAQVQSDDVIAQVVSELFHLKRQRVRLHQRHALDVVVRQAAPLRQRLEQIAPPQRFFRRLRFRNVDTQRMLQLRRIDAIEDARHIEQRRRDQFARNQPGLVQVQSARAGEDHRAIRLNVHASGRVSCRNS